MRRRFKAVMDVLDAMIRYGVSLSRSVELTAQWDRILAAGPLYLVIPDDLSLDRGMGIGAFHQAVSMFIGVSVTFSLHLWFTVDMRRLGSGGIGFVKIPWCILIDGLGRIWFCQLHFSSVSPILHLVVKGSLLTLLGLMRNSEKPGCPTFVVLGKGRPALRNSLLK